MERSALESTGRDLVQQFSTQGRLNMRSSRLVFEWLLATLEIGRAVLTVQAEYMARLYTHYQHPQIAGALDSIKNYFEALPPREALLSDLKETIAVLRDATRPSEPIRRSRFESLIVELL